MSIFRRKSIFFIPIHLTGWALLTVAIMLAIYQFVVIERLSHSVSDTLINWFFRLIIIGAFYSMIGFAFSREE